MDTQLKMEFKRNIPVFYKSVNFVCMYQFFAVLHFYLVGKIIDIEVEIFKIYG